MSSLFRRRLTCESKLNLVEVAVAKIHISCGEVSA